MIDPGTATLLGAGVKTGGEALGGFFGWLGSRGRRGRAKGEYEDFLRQYGGDRSRMLGMMGEDMFDPTFATQYAQRGASKYYDQLLSSFDTEGMDISQPQAKGALMEGSGQNLQDMLMELYMMNAQAKHGRRGETSRFLAGQSGSQLGGARSAYYG